MAKKNTKTNKKRGVSKLAVGAGLATLGAGAYYLLGPDGKKHQIRAKKLLTQIQREIAKDIKLAAKSDVGKTLQVAAVNYLQNSKSSRRNSKR